MLDSSSPPADWISMKDRSHYSPRVQWSWDGLVDQVRAHCDLNEETGCLLWRRGRSEKGYGRFTIEGNGWYVHRAVLYAATGVLGEEALHSCDTPPCTNLEHLRWGSRLDNMHDAVSRDRMAAGARHYARQSPQLVLRGSRNGSAKVTDHQVAEIRQRYAMSNVSQAALGAEYGISQTEVGRIVRGARWSHSAAVNGVSACKLCNGLKDGARSDQPWCRSCRTEVYFESGRLSLDEGQYSKVLAAKYGVAPTMVANWARRGRALLREAHR